MKRLMTAGVLCALILSGCSASQGLFSSNITIDDIYNTWQNTKSIAYSVTVLKADGAVPTAEQTGDMRLYSKDRTKSRVEVVVQGQKTVFISNKDTKLYAMYYPETNSYIDFGPGKDGENDQVSNDLDVFYQGLKENFKITGKDTINGSPAVILEGDTDGVHEKFWVDTKLKLPVKFQTIVDGVAKDDIELRDISTATIDDAMFAIPAGATTGNMDELFKDYFPKQ